MKYVRNFILKYRNVVLVFSKDKHTGYPEREAADIF